MYERILKTDIQSHLHYFRASQLIYRKSDYQNSPFPTKASLLSTQPVSHSLCCSTINIELNLETKSLKS